MVLIILVIAAVVLMVVGLWFGVLIVSLLWHLFIGLIIGGIARFVLPAHYHMSLLKTALCGVVGSLVGGLVARHVFGVEGVREFLLSIGCAAGLIWILNKP